MIFVFFFELLAFLYVWVVAFGFVMCGVPILGLVFFLLGIYCGIMGMLAVTIQ